MKHKLIHKIHVDLPLFCVFKDTPLWDWIYWSLLQLIIISNNQIAFNTHHQWMKSRGSYYYLEHHTFTSQNNKVCAIIITRCFFCGRSGGLKSSHKPNILSPAAITSKNSRKTNSIFRSTNQLYKSQQTYFENFHKSIWIGVTKSRA